MKPLEWRDVSRSIYPEMTLWPGDPATSLHPDTRIAAGDSCNTSAVHCSTHAGTHIDAPWHFIESGKRLHEVDFQYFFGRAEVLEIPFAGLIEVQNLPATFQAPRVLLKTRNSALPEDAPFQQDFAALSPEAAQHCVDSGVKLLGIDAYSAAPFGNSSPTHHILLGAEVLLVEGLRLAAIPPGLCEFTVLPLPLHNADGAPCRAFVGLLPE